MQAAALVHKSLCSNWKVLMSVVQPFPMWSLVVSFLEATSLVGVSPMLYPRHMNSTNLGLRSLLSCL